MKIKSDSLLDPRQYSGFTLWLKANNWETELNSKLKPFKTTQNEVLMLISLVFLSGGKSEIRQSDLAQFTGVSPMSVSKTLSKLEKKNLITRLVGKDSRSKAISITKIGMEILTSTATILVETNNNFFPNKSKPEFDQYLNQL
ncbi:MAG: MarR family winged helix-turn-helix transcriptional regulator [Patescibacteria group bacterium]